MVSRRTNSPSALEPAPVPGRQLLISTRLRTFTRPLRAGETVVLGTGSEVVLDEGPARALSLELLEDGSIDVRVLEGASVRLNDVQVATRTQAHVGDLLELGPSALLVQASSAPPPPRRSVLSAEAFELQLDTEVLRAERSGRPLSLWAVRSRALGRAGPRRLLEQPELVPDGAFSLGEFAPGVWLMLLPEASLAQSEAPRARLAQALARMGEPAQWGHATLPQDGVQGHALLGRALERLLSDDLAPDEEPLRFDPVMARLYELLDRWAASPGPFVLHGEASVGKEVFARALHARAERDAPGAPFIAFACGEYSQARWDSALERARGGTLYLQHLPALPASVRAGLASGLGLGLGLGLEGLRLVVSAPGAVELGAPVQLLLPPLRDRPLDILPLAESFLLRAGERLGRSGLSLTPAAQALLRQDRWPGNLRELKNAMVRAALAADTGEVRPEHLPPRLLREQAGPGEAGDLRATMKAQEREVLLAALGRTSWNVTAAALALGLPRRTVVYRMSKLGLRRPPRTPLPGP